MTPARPLCRCAILLALTVQANGAGPGANVGSHTQPPPRKTAEPSDDADWQKRGRESLNRCDWANAVSAFDRAIANEPHQADSYYLRALARERLGRSAEALEDYERAIGLRSDWGAARLRRGNLLMRTGKPAQGLKEQKKALRLGRLEEAGLELIYVEPGSSVEFRFVYVPPGEGVIGYEEEVRLKMVKQTLQPFFGHNAAPAQRIRVEQGFFLLDREITAAQYGAFAPRPRKQRTVPERSGKAALVAALAAAEKPSPREEDDDAAGIAPSEANVPPDSAKKASPAPTTPPAKAAAAPRPQDCAAPAAQRPLAGVSWDEANSFCRRFQARLGLAIRMPTEIEWEYAARGGGASLYPWSDDGFHAWAERPESSPRPYASNSRDISWVGAYDMAGNVSEWCWDAYRQSLFHKPPGVLPYCPADIGAAKTGSRDAADPPKKRKPPARAKAPGDSPDGASESGGAAQSTLAVAYRGGSFRDNRFNCQSPLRRSAVAGSRDPAIGFRPALLMKVVP